MMLYFARREFCHFYEGVHKLDKCEEIIEKTLEERSNGYVMVVENQ